MSTLEGQHMSGVSEKTKTGETQVVRTCAEEGYGVHRTKNAEVGGAR